MLDAWLPGPSDTAGMDLAERLALWLTPLDAIGLQAAHRAMQAVPEGAAALSPAQARARAATLAADTRRVNDALAQAIAAAPPGPGAGDANYSRYGHRHGALQRQMAQMIGPLRNEVRQAMATVSPALRRLALLDAALEQVIAPREHQLLPVAVALLGKRFEQLRAGQAPGWEGAFAREWREALLAERDLRLAPVAGLVEAMNNGLKNRA